MTPKYLPGDVLRMPDGNLWLVVNVMTSAHIYTLHARSGMQPVSVVHSGRELERMHPVKVTRLPEEIRAEGIAEALDMLGREADLESTLEGLWNLAFSAGLAAREQDLAAPAR
jgi:hypothetical protein